MDVSIIDASKVTTKNGLKIGSDLAPVKMVEFMNVRCPYCKKWFDDSFDLLNSLVEKGKVQRIIKLFDKEKESLKPGNIMHHHIDYTTPEKSLVDLQQIYATQNVWGNLSLKEIATFAEERLGLSKQIDSGIVSSVIKEAEAANIKFVPTIVVGKHIFDESVTKEELLVYLQA